VRRILSILAAFVVFYGVGHASAQQLVVIESTAPEIVPGQVIDGAKPLKLGAGASVTVVAESGAVATFKGPFSGVPQAGGGKGDPSLVAALSKIVGEAAKGGTTLGVMRGAKPPVQPGAWEIDVQRPGTYCAAAGRPPGLWRSDAAAGGTVSFHLLPGGEKVTVEWPEGKDTIPWPKNLPLKDDAQYLAKVSWRSAVAKIAVYVVPEGLASDAHRVVWMHNQGCVQQAKALLASLR
jgi:hypothetical protein